MYSRTVLNNGVRVVTHPMKDKESLAIGIWLNVGSRYEAPHLAGISHFLEHMVFKGTKNYGCQQIKESIEGVGGTFNAFTSEEATCYLTKLPGRYMDMALDILSEMVVCPRLPHAEIERERTVILEEIKMYRDHPQSYVYELLDNLLWPDQALGTSILGTEGSVSSLKREDLIGYRQDHYSPPNIIISAAGHMNMEFFLRRVRRIFGGLRGGTINPFAPARESYDGPRVKLFTKATEQSHLALGFHALHRDHPLRYALWLLHVILGANSSSRLFNEIREKHGLAYEIGTTIKRLRDTGSFIVHAGVDTAKVEETLRRVLKELGRIADTKVAPGELARAKEFFLGQLMISLEDTLDNMLWNGENVLFGDTTRTIKQLVRRIRSVEAGHLRALSRLLFHPEKMNLALIGPPTKEKRIKKLMRMA